MKDKNHKAFAPKVDIHAFFFVKGTHEFWQKAKSRNYSPLFISKVNLLQLSA